MVRLRDRRVPGSIFDTAVDPPCTENVYVKSVGHGAVYHRSRSLETISLPFGGMENCGGGDRRWQRLSDHEAEIGLLPFMGLICLGAAPSSP